MESLEFFVQYFVQYFVLHTGYQIAVCANLFRTKTRCLLGQLVLVSLAGECTHRQCHCFFYNCLSCWDS